MEIRCIRALKHDVDPGQYVYVRSWHTRDLNILPLT